MSHQSDHRAWTYAQEYGGQKLHIVEKFADGCISSYAICGRSNAKRGQWRMEIGLPLGKACKRCVRIAQ